MSIPFSFDKITSLLSIGATGIFKESSKQMENMDQVADPYSYTTIKVARDEDLFEQIGKHIYCDLVDHDKVSSFVVQNQISFKLFKEEIAKSFGVPVKFQRFWFWVYRDNKTYRPDRPLTQQEENKTVGQLMELLNVAHGKELKLFLEVELGQDLRPVRLPGKMISDILLFFKLYDPVKEELRYVGKLIVKGTSKPVEILGKLNKMAGFFPDEEIQLFEEIRFDQPTVRCDRIDSKITFHASELEDGDIICFQKCPPLERPCSSRHDSSFPSFLNYNHQLSSFRRFVGTVENQPVEEQPLSARLTWTIENFSKLNTEKLYSDIFFVGGCKWRVLIYPNGNNVNQLSMYLHVVDWSNLPSAQFSLVVVNQINDKYNVKKDAQHQFTASYKDKGFTSFMDLDELNNQGQGYLVNDTCVIEAVVDVYRQRRKRRDAVHRVIYNLKYDAKKEPYDMPIIENDLTSGRTPQRNSTPSVNLTETDPNEVKGPALTTMSGEVRPLPKYPSAGQLYEAGPHCNKCVDFDEQNSVKFGHVDVGGFSILKKQVLLYKEIWLKYGHIATSQVLTDSYAAQVTVVTKIMTCIMDMYRYRRNEVSLTQIILWENKIKMAERLEFNIRWLRERFEDVKKDFYGEQKLMTSLLKQDMVAFTEAKARVKELNDELKNAWGVEVYEEFEAAEENLSALENRINPLLLQKQMYTEKGSHLLLEGVLSYKLA